VFANLKIPKWSLRLDMGAQTLVVNAILTETFVSKVSSRVGTSRRTFGHRTFKTGLSAMT
jgi:hypothetical protein